MNQISLDTETTDEDFFATLESNKSKLSSLFGFPTNQQNENPTLKYQATKQKDSAIVSQQTAASDIPQSWSVELAKVVTGYKDSISVGKVGVAILRNPSEESKIIVYKTKTNVLATLTLQLEKTPEMYRQTPYIQFYDDVRSYWSLLFEKENDETEFVSKLNELEVEIRVQEQKQEKHEEKLDKRKSKSKVHHENELEKNKGEVAPEHNSKATLVSRMARMGQKLPTVTSARTEYTDSSDTEVISTPSAMSNKPITAPRNSKLVQRPLVTTASSSNCVDVYGNYNFPLQLHETQVMHVLMSENRTQNTEIRMNMNKLESKIEKVLDKIDLMGTANASKNNKEDEILELEEKILDLKKENRKLKQQAFDGDTNNTSFKKFSTLHASDLNELRIVNHDNWESLGEAFIESIKNMQDELKKLKAGNSSLENELQENTKEYLVQCSALEATQLNLKTLENELVDSKSEFEKMSNTTKELQSKLETLEKTHAEEQIRQSEKVQTTVKEIMNNLYIKIAAKLNNVPRGSLGNEQILAMIGKAIRNETLQEMRKPSSLEKKVNFKSVS